MKFLRILLVAFFAISCRAQTVKISDLPAITTVGGSALVAVVDMTGTPTTKKATVGQLAAGLPLATPTSDGLMPQADKAALTNATSSATASTLVKRDSSGNISANAVTMVTGTVTNAPVADTDIANKIYVDATASGLKIKTPAAAATSANVNLGAAPNTLDGYTLQLNDRVLVKNQTDDTQNGLYYVQTLGTGSNGVWLRTSDADDGTKLVTGSYVYVTNGTAYSNSAWVMTTPGAITIGTSHITWALFSQIGQIQASNIIGQIVTAQIADAAINFTKFANTIQPVALVSSLPSPTGYTGPKTLFNTSDGKLYRYTGTAFTAAVNTSDLSGTITTTQIADNSISTPKLQANSVTAGQIAANAVQAGNIAANAVTSGTIAAGAVSTTELAAGAVTSGKILSGTILSTNIAALTITGANIAAGTITVDKLSVSQLSAITANLGTCTAGQLTGVNFTAGSGANTVTIDASGFRIGTGGSILDLRSYAGNTAITVNGGGSYSGHYLQLNSNGSSGIIPPSLQCTGGSKLVVINENAIYASGGATITVDSGSAITGPGSLKIINGVSDGLNIIAGEFGSAGSQIGYMSFTLNGRAVKVPFYTY